MYLHNHTDIKVWDSLKIVINIGTRLELRLIVVTMLRWTETREDKVWLNELKGITHEGQGDHSLRHSTPTPVPRLGLALRVHIAC